MAEKGKSRKRSLAWTYFTDEGSNMAKCHVCSKLISYKGGATFNLTRHLRLMHTANSKAATSPKKLINIKKNIKRDKDDDEFIIEWFNVNGNGSPMVVPQKGSNSMILPTAATPGKLLSIKKSQDVDISLIEMLVKNFYPVEFVDSPHFKLFVSNISPSYQIPSRKNISTVLLPHLLEKTKATVRLSLESTSAVAITIDSWTSVINENFISLTGHFIDNEIALKTYLIECFRYDSKSSTEDLAKEIKRIVCEWQIEEKVVAIVSNNNEGIVEAIQMTGFNYIPCFAHNLDLMVEEMLKDVEEIIEKAKEIVEFFKCSPQARTDLNMVQTEMGEGILNLKQAVTTSWTATYDMLARLLRVKEPLTSTITMNYPHLKNLTSTDLLTIESVCELLRTFKEGAEEICNEKYISISKLVLLSQVLKKSCMKFLNKTTIPKNIRDLSKKLFVMLKEQIRQIEENEIFAEATILDPRFKRHGFADVDLFEKVKESIIAQTSTMCVIEEEIPSTSAIKEEPGLNSSIWEEFDAEVSSFIKNPDPAAGVLEMEKYLEEPLLPRQSNPFYWWHERQNIYPRLFHIVKTRLCIIGTCVPGELIYTKEGHALIERRNQLRGNKVPQIVFLNANI